MKIRRLLASVAVALVAVTATLTPARAQELQVSWDQSSWASALPGSLFDGPTTTVIIWRQSAWEDTGTLAPNPDAYRIHPGAGLRSYFFVKNTSTTAARLGIFARKEVTELPQKTDPFADDDRNVLISMTDPGPWGGNEPLTITDKCRVVGQMIVPAGAEVKVSVDAYMPMGTVDGQSGVQTVTLPTITAAMTPADTSSPFTRCTRPGTNAIEEPTPDPVETPDPAQPSATPSPSQQPGSPSTAPAPPVDNKPWRPDNLARTGATVMAWMLLTSALILPGTWMIAAARRRRERRDDTW